MERPRGVEGNVLLREWLKENNHSLSSFSILCGLSRTTLQASLKHQKLTEDVLNKIYIHTNKQVTPNDILLEKWSEGGEGSGEYTTLDPDAPQGGQGGGGALHRGARRLSHALHALADEVALL